MKKKNSKVDQSGKIEDTSKDTAIAFSNNIFKSIRIRAKDKREIQELFREVGRSRIFVYKLFAILIFLLIKDHLDKINQLIIDIEYPGWEYLIKDYLLRETRRIKPDFDPDNISFSRIGKKSKAHDIAYQVFKEKREPDIKVKAKDILKFIVK